MKTWYVSYIVFGKEHLAGPYTFDEAVDQKRDIEGYEHVHDARVTFAEPAREPVQT